jgi:hypothetical protein
MKVNGSGTSAAKAPKVRVVRAFMPEDVAQYIVDILTTTQQDGVKITGSFDPIVQQGIDKLKEGIAAPPRKAPEPKPTPDGVSWGKQAVESETVPVG